MHLDRKITLYQPGQIQINDEGIRSRAPALGRQVHAKRVARSGSEGISVETSLQETTVDYMIRNNPVVAGINKDWWLEDGGQDYRIESVYEPAIGRRQFLTIRAVART